MHVETGHSSNKDGAKAVEEATRSWPRGFSPDLVLVFHSIEQDAAKVAQTLSARFPKARIAGCTTAGEHLNGQHFNGSLVLSAVSSPGIKWAVAHVDGIKGFSAANAGAVRDQLLSQLGIVRDSLSPERHFCLTFIDGLSMKEESISALMAEALDGIPFLGGSAGDDLKFTRTQVIAGGKAYGNGAVFVMADSQEPFTVLKHQHFVKTPRQLVITKVDTQARRVYEMDGRPALDAYAAALGLDRAKVTPEVCFANPVTFRVNNELYVRSVQKIESDGSIIFYCGVEEGMVLEIGGHEDMVEALSRDLKPVTSKTGKSELFLACNCILRALEAGGTKQHDALGKIVATLSRHVIGFDTYGEQLNGLHINQTLVGIALGRAA